MKITNIDFTDEEWAAIEERAGRWRPTHALAATIRARSAEKGKE